jgi:hypothetical protein
MNLLSLFLQGFEALLLQNAKKPSKYLVGEFVLAILCVEESIDDSTKFDRYHLLNQIYSKVYDCKKNIKPAPDPHYLLEKFYGSLSIQEYRKLLKTEHLLLVIDKPLTRILPELHEDTDDAFTKIYGVKPANGNASGVYKVKRQSEQPVGPSKASIIRNTFGITN